MTPTRVRTEAIAGITPIEEMKDAAAMPPARRSGEVSQIELPLTPEGMAAALRRSVTRLSPFASRSTDVQLGHPLVSRRHCEVFESGGILMIRDLGSLNGTFVGPTRLWYVTCQSARLHRCAVSRAEMATNSG